MSKRALVFPPSNAIGTGMFDCYTQFPWTRDMLQTLDDVVGDNLCKKVAQEKIEVWAKPEYAFPAIALDSILNLEQAKQCQGLDLQNFDYCLGISLGEFIAGCVLNDFPLDKTLEMLNFLGKSMQLVPNQNKWRLLVLNADVNYVGSLIHDEPNVYIALDMGPRVSTITGPIDDLYRIKNNLKKTKKRGNMLPIFTGAHNPHQKWAGERFAAYFAKMDLKKMSIPIMSNYKAHPYTEGEELITALKYNNHYPCLVKQSIKYLIDEGVDTYYDTSSFKGSKGIIGDNYGKAKIEFTYY